MSALNIYDIMCSVYSYQRMALMILLLALSQPHHFGVMCTVESISVYFTEITLRKRKCMQLLEKVEVMSISPTVLIMHQFMICDVR